MPSVKRRNRCLHNMFDSQNERVVSRIGQLFERGRTADHWTTMPALLALGREIGAEVGESLMDQHPELLDFVPIASRDYLEYICAQERAEAEHLLSGSSQGGFRYIDRAETFGRHNYDRVRDMFDVVDFSSRRRFVLVGCGPLPLTLYHVHDRTAVTELIGIDVDFNSVEKVNATARSFGLNRVAAHAVSGEQFDFAGADVVYVANLVRPKRLVLKRIADTAPRTAAIVLRDPYSLGRLLTERGTDDLDPRFEVTGVSPPELSHFSRHVFLQIADAAHS
jgi:SAM-dependent methyltransferase